ncbi:hypothetical protein C8J56DRAFT_901080 [Mycena floridula]|nr:hypothetical protein C8J56DRAFT_901080 [Mycena floridula]
MKESESDSSELESTSERKLATMPKVWTVYKRKETKQQETPQRKTESPPHPTNSPPPCKRRRDPKLAVCDVGYVLTRNSDSLSNGDSVDYKDDEDDDVTEYHGPGPRPPEIDPDTKRKHLFVYDKLHKKFKRTSTTALWLRAVQEMRVRSCRWRICVGRGWWCACRGGLCGGLEEVSRRALTENLFFIAGPQVTGCHSGLKVFLVKATVKAVNERMAWLHLFVHVVSMVVPVIQYGSHPWE